MMDSDRTTFVDTDMVQRGLANIAPLKVTFRGTPQEQTTLMDSIESHFRVYQYKKDNGVSFGEHELFFWCACDMRTGENDMEYFYLMFNDRQSIGEREKLCSRLRFFLDGYSGGDICFEYHSEENFEATRIEAMRVFMRCKGRRVQWRGMVGWLKWNERNGYYFMKIGARKNGYLLSNSKVCDIQPK